MKSLLIFLAVVAAAFANPYWEQEENSFPMSEELSDFDENYDPIVEAAFVPLVQDVFESAKTYLILGNNNKFLSVVNYGGVGGYDYIESVKTQQDVFCRFAASTLYNGKVALRNRPKGKYLQLDKKGYIQPTAVSISTAAQFEVEVSSRGPWIGARFVYLKATNGKYLGINSSNRIVATFKSKGKATRLIVLDAR